jgi:hypothetical protein
MDGAIGILLLHFVCTSFLCGLIWFVQICHYPLFAELGPEAKRYHEGHMKLTTRVVLLPMCVELATALYLFFRPAFITREEAGIGLVLLAVIWLSTALLQVPLHTRLTQTFAIPTVQRLVRTNWIRTTAWSLRVLLLLSVLGRQGYVGF